MPTFQWQADAWEILKDIVGNRERDASVEAGVGSGKTRMSSTFAKSYLGREFDRVVVLTINRRCIRQWYDEMKRHGILLKKVFGNAALTRGLPADVSGYIGTYTGMGMFPDLHETFCNNRTLVIFDEIHHLNENPKAKWGAHAKKAFDSAAFRLSLSGTYFSSTGHAIPFARLEPQEGSNTLFEYNPHIKYTYGESVADLICRRIVFKPWNGPIQYRRDDTGPFKTVTFDDLIPREEEGTRLWAALYDKDENQMVADMLRSADRLLHDIRLAGHTKAGGIVVCIDQDHARFIKKRLEKVTGQKAVLVISDEEDADAALDAFDKGYAPWLVSVRMVAEGVDIKRLRVCVYLTNVTEPLLFIQIMGRCVRIGEDGPPGEAYFFYPGDHRLKEIAQTVEDDIRRAIDLKDKKRREGGTPGMPGYRESGIVQGEEQDNIIAGEQFAPVDVDVAEQMRLRHPDLSGLSILSLSRFVQEAREGQRRQYQTEAEQEDHDTLRGIAQRRVGQLGHMTGTDHNKLHSASNQAAGIRTVETATIVELKRKIAWLDEQIVIAKNGR